MSEPVTLAAVLPSLESRLLTEPERFPRVRAGEREPISPQKRRLIYERDGYTCRWCYGAVGYLQLDHIVPWSAGGSDRSDNLRTLCERCNADRSNFADRIDPNRVLDVTLTCVPCRATGPETELPIPCYCGECGQVSWTDDDKWLL